MSTAVQYTDTAPRALPIAGFHPQLTHISFICLCVCSHGRNDIQHMGNVNIIQFTTIIAVPDSGIPIFFLKLDRKLTFS
jgi:hypothetical protein